MHKNPVDTCESPRAAELGAGRWGEEWFGKWAMNLMRANRAKCRCREWVHRQPC
jgi:hypothetical protein